jgi:hypothetical protein
VPAEPGGELLLGAVIIPQDAIITAERLVVSKQLTMNGQGKLGAATGHYIAIVPNVTVIKMNGNDKSLPSLNLGEVPEGKEVVPQALKVQTPTSLSSTELGTFYHILINASPFSNCDQWKEVLQLSSTTTFEGECAPDTEGRLLVDKTSLVIKGVPPQRTVHASPSGSPSGTTGVSGGAIAGIVVGVVVVVGAVIGVVFFLRKKGDGTGDDDAKP